MNQTKQELSGFMPEISQWFFKKYSGPTDVQLQAWERAKEGKNFLMTAPTGCGKTLAGFLWSLNQLFSGAWERNGTSVLYISPLKALNNDIRKNLFEPLEQISGLLPPGRGRVTVGLRSGDTDEAERRRIKKERPDIFITTPETLNIMLASQGADGWFASIKCVILDEIHAVAGTKRGVHLMTAIERLVPFAGEFQRIGISATISPLPRIARFLGGWQLDSLGRFSERPVEIIESADSKSYAVKVYHGAEDFEARIRDKIETNRNTLIFTNSRKSAETLTARINKAGQICYTHHGSLSKEIRLAVEESLKQGKLKAVAATSSLELGIDIGQIDEVVLYGTPFFLSSSVQKAGRAGHGVGKTTVLTIFAEGKRDLLNAVVTADCVRKKMSEPVRPVVNALDILVQVILEFCARVR